MNTQTIGLIKHPIKKEVLQKDEEPPLPKPRWLMAIMQKLIDGWVKMMDQGVAV